MSRLLGTGAGYFINDERNSGGGVQEADVLTCAHCEAVILLQAWRKERSLGGGTICRKCSSPVCNACGELMLTQGCTPFIKLIDQAVEATYRRQQNLKVLGI